MIRNVVMGRLRDSSEGAVAQLRWDFAIVNDFTDADAYVAYDHDPDHLRYRAAIVALCADVARVQFEI